MDIGDVGDETTFHDGDERCRGLDDSFGDHVKQARRKATHAVVLKREIGKLQ